MKQYNNIATIRQAVHKCIAGPFSAVCIVLFFIFTIASCEIEPELHLHGKEADVSFKPVIDLNLEVYWDYELVYGVVYDWQNEWYYGWDERDEEIFGTLGYVEPNVFQIRRYHTGMVKYGPHKRPLEDMINGYHYRAKYDWGFWDLLLWNDIRTLDGVQSLIFDENTSYEYVTAYTNQTMNAAHYNAKYSRSFYQPEPLFAAYERGIEINEDMTGFRFDSINNVYVKTLEMQLEPITYIYLTQVILHHNNGRVTNVDGNANLSGMARTVCVNDGVAGSDQITVNYNNRFKKNCSKNGELVDIAGGRLLTFGMCNINANRVGRSSRLGPTRVDDGVHHYMDVTFQFNNGKDSTLVFDVTDQVQTRYKGGVLTVELDMDTVPIPNRSGGSGMDAVVEDWQDAELPEFGFNAKGYKSKKRKR